MLLASLAIVATVSLQFLGKESSEALNICFADNCSGTIEFGGVNIGGQGTKGEGGGEKGS